MAGEPTAGHENTEPIEVDRVEESEEKPVVTSGVSQEKRDRMNAEMKRFLNYLSDGHIVFKPDEAFKMLSQYISLYERIMYSTVSVIIYEITNKDYKSNSQDIFGSMLTNAEALLDYAEGQKYKSEKDIIFKTKRAAWKIYDHINLAHTQYGELRQSEAEYEERFKKAIEPVQKEITKDMNSQLLAMVGIFTALAFVLFGGISSLENVLSGLKDTHLLRLLIVGCGWGLGIADVMFVLLYCIGEMTKLNLKSSLAPDATFIQKYPVVCWVNFILGSLLSIFMWLYYCVNRNGSTLLDRIIKSNPTGSSIIGVVAIVIAIIAILVVMHNKAHHKKKE